MVRDPTEYEARSLLYSGGVHYKDKHDRYEIKCPFHKGGQEKNASAALYKKNWMFKCFTCNTVYNFAGLHKVLLGKPWKRNKDFSLTDPVEAVHSVSYTKERIAFEMTSGIIKEVYNNPQANAYCHSRFMSDDFISFFKVRCTKSCSFSGGSHWKDRLLIPIYKDGKLYSLEGRDYTRKQKPKCLYPRGAYVDICFNQDNLDKEKPLIVCEGIMDIPKIWGKLTTNVTCTFGVSLSQSQKDYLKDAKNLILFIDDDEAGRKSIELFKSFMQNDFKVAFVKGKDPGDSSFVELRDAIQNARYSYELDLDAKEDIKPKTFSL